MVEVVAVESQQDADLLVGALRRRGYQASATHNAGEKLIHVRTGPYKNRAEAEATRRKLVSDGYPATVL